MSKTERERTESTSRRINTVARLSLNQKENALPILPALSRFRTTFRGRQLRRVPGQGWRRQKVLGKGIAQKMNAHGWRPMRKKRGLFHKYLISEIVADQDLYVWGTFTVVDNGFARISQAIMEKIEMEMEGGMKGRRKAGINEKDRAGKEEKVKRELCG